MLGELHPAKIFQAIPSDSVLYPMVETTEKGGRLEYDPSSNQLTISDAGPAHVREKNLKRLAKTLDHPIKFAHAWSWFVCLTNYKYRDPDLSSAMMRFGWKVVAYSITNDWATVLRVFVDLATPLLTGSLLRVKSAFDSVSFAEALGPYRTNSTVQSISAFGNTVAYPTISSEMAGGGGAVTQSSSGQVNAAKGDKPICRRWNKGICDGMGCKFRHICLHCKAEHPQTICPIQPVPQQPHVPGYGMGYSQQGFGNTQQSFNPHHQGSNYNAYPGNSQYGQNYGGQQGYNPQQGQGFPQHGPGQQSNGIKPKTYGSQQQVKQGQA